ncbi:pyridoxal phosphate-dependent decarboxylase family protein [Rhizosphaericola mali]|uniref:Aspartate aminotransferase family protein n=1 Tax=Rhizosphaericola mali TaxID=2545455 RepID=A0A5P2G0B8_9BACT|nr:pyridoxal-dependent decarboxylase [Rhizosphaericola mali]QES87559.1 aspartate aminotransferase family protein [Rhizosphaericola mali]
MKYWKRLSASEQDRIITEALEKNISYAQNSYSLGVPASQLDEKVFDDKVSFLKDAPLLRTYVANPNHIGCHTMGNSELFFAGTQKLEAEVIELLSVDVLHAEENSCDGFIAAGGTEANLQACWIYRNYYAKEFGAKNVEIVIISSEDTHYSIPKASNLLSIDWISVPVDPESREIRSEEVKSLVQKAVAQGKKYFIVVTNMGTTMFGSVDDPHIYSDVFKQMNLPFCMHVDGAFGGFIYPISQPENLLNFHSTDVISITLDAHKMLQAPYGTGVFLIRKNWMKYVYTEEAQYVHGMDITLNGSRSGTNAVAVWMILNTYGPFGWLEKINKLLYRTTYLCDKLLTRKISFYRNTSMNIVTIKANAIKEDVAEKYGLVPDSHDQPNWYKIVVMDHVDLDILEKFIADLDK